VTSGVTDLYGDQAFDVELRAVTKRFGSLIAVKRRYPEGAQGRVPLTPGAVRLRQDHLVAADPGFEQPDEGKILIGGRDAADARRTSATSTPCSSTTRCSRTGLDAALGLR
jgi:hypothetical protein